MIILVKIFRERKNNIHFHPIILKFLSNFEFLYCHISRIYHDTYITALFYTFSIGQVRLYEENWRKFVNKTLMQPPLLKTWNSRDYHFSCSIYLGVCINQLSFRQTLQYRVDYGNGTGGVQPDKVVFQKGA